MPLPATDAIAFRGIPSLGDKATIALSLTLTQKQVEVMFARQASINKLTSQSATQFPLEIDFDNRKMYIGDTVTSFNSGKETGIREICRRTPSSAKPSAGLFLSATVVGKLTIPRGLDDAASDLRKAIEAEQTKKNERGIVRIDTPIAALNGKKSRASGVVSLAKRAMTNGATSSRINSTTPHPAISTVSTNSSKLTSSRSPSLLTTPPITSNLTIKDPDFNSLRSRLIHFIAAVARPREVAISEFMSASRATDSEADVRKIFDQVAQEIPGPKNSDSARWIWDLKSDSWLEVRPFGFPDYAPDQRTQASRRARIGSGISSQNPVWEHFSTRVDSSALASAKAITAAGIGGGMYSNAKSKKAATKPNIPKMKSASKLRLEDDGDLKPRKLPPAIEETKIKAKIDPISTSTPSTVQPAPRPSKKSQDDALLKTRAPSTSVKKEPSPRPPLPADGSIRKRKLVDLELEPTSDMEEGELPSKEPKRRRVIGLPEVSKPESLKKFDSPAITKKVPVTEKDIVSLSTSKHNRESQGTKVAAAASSPRNNNKSLKPEADVKQEKDREPHKARVRERDDERERDRDREKEKEKENPREKEKVMDKERDREREKREPEKGRDYEKEKERHRNRHRINDTEESVDRNKGPAPVKHKRRPTPSFSSDDEKDETLPLKRAIPSSRPAFTSTTAPKANVTKEHKLISGPATLPEDKEGLRREYNMYYAHYMHITSKLYAQKAKVETALVLEDGANADEDSDLMDLKELSELCEEFHWTRNELERIRKAHGNLNVNAF
ncbi:hypothetical protein Clacol_000641 [Clathrus columnatus]|uniref:Uncharacterized protein n=1 Tax=Clathrus columnatus TaxID=1419009 RepID=A0AAV4ZWX2_9AGAM|nr:hypothetical protein Clacol_000641 [Clathrus columnatus]